jgi:hypothetical protein
MEKMTNLTQWHQEEFLPWQQAAQRYLQAKEQQRQKFLDSVGGLQTVVALLLSGKTKAAVLAWNNLGLHPQLQEIKLSLDGGVVTLVTMSGEPTVLKVNDMLQELQQLLDSKTA